MPFLQYLSLFMRICIFYCHACPQQGWQYYKQINTFPLWPYYSTLRGLWLSTVLWVCCSMQHVLQVFNKVMQFYPQCPKRIRTRFEPVGNPRDQGNTGYTGKGECRELRQWTYLSAHDKRKEKRPGKKHACDPCYGIETQACNKG